MFVNIWIPGTFFFILHVWMVVGWGFFYQNLAGYVKMALIMMERKGAGGETWCLVYFGTGERKGST